MPMETTVIGSYPKPDDLRKILPDWFPNHSDFTIESYSTALKEHGLDEIKKVTKQAVKEVIDEQIGLGIDVITDGEIMRENYIFHFCRQIQGIDFSHPYNKTSRCGACTLNVPVITGKLSPRTTEPWCYHEWEQAQSLSKVPVKFTLPGPLTILATTHLDAPRVYNSPEDIMADLVPIINREVLALAAAGCQYIQIDEPVFMRQPDDALNYGIDQLTLCFKGLPAGVQKVVHLCCGYPGYLDEDGYEKAEREGYKRLATKLDEAGFDQISIEDAHCHNDLDLFGLFKKTKLIVGVVKIASSRIESEEEIVEHVKDILEFIPSDRLILAPDCGLGFLSNREVRIQKLRNMVGAAKRFS